MSCFIGFGDFGMSDQRPNVNCYKQIRYSIFRIKGPCYNGLTSTINTIGSLGCLASARFIRRSERSERKATRDRPSVSRSAKIEMSEFPLAPRVLNRSIYFTRLSHKLKIFLFRLNIRQNKPDSEITRAVEFPVY